MQMSENLYLYLHLNENINYVYIKYINSIIYTLKYSIIL